MAENNPSPDGKIGSQLFQVVSEDDVNSGKGTSPPQQATSSSGSSPSDGGESSAQQRQYPSQPSVSRQKSTFSTDSSSSTAPILKPDGPNDLSQKITYELDGRPLPDLDHHYYDPDHDAPPDSDPPSDLAGCWRSGDNFRAFIKHNHHYHLFIAFLIVVDIIIVIGELIVDLEILRKNDCSHDHDCPIIKLNGTSPDTTCHYDSHNTVCIYSHGLRRCVEPHTHHDLDPAEVLHYMSIAILACFVLETIVRAIALGREFFQRKIELLDGVIVTVAFVLDLTISHNAAVSLLLFIRLWRVTRIVNGIAIAVESREAHIRSHLRKVVYNLKFEVKRKRETVDMLRLELSEWQKAGAAVYNTPADLSGGGGGGGSRSGSDGSAGNAGPGEKYLSADMLVLSALAEDDHENI